MAALIRISVIVCLALGLISTPALAAPKITETVQTYPVSATTLQGLRREMKTKGPKGFWGFTRWVVKWSGTCDVEVDVTYTLPRHEKPNTMPADVRQKFDRMLRNLDAHERLHGQHGINAGREIVQNGCRNAHEIIKKYSKADKTLDRQSRHGRRDGVELN